MTNNLQVIQEHIEKVMETLKQMGINDSFQCYFIKEIEEKDRETEREKLLQLQETKKVGQETMEGVKYMVVADANGHIIYTRVFNEDEKDRGTLLLLLATYLQNLLGVQLRFSLATPEEWDLTQESKNIEVNRLVN